MWNIRDLWKEKKFNGCEKESIHVEYSHREAVGRTTASLNEEGEKDASAG